ncbi:MAG: glycosyltransferase family 39 protein, partial [Candidatus Gottesmanbacteria bacterium]|nr:glycosyltransferase family 39 protein [Candidatus Gottesmanbacteria bacterium]
MRPTHKRLLLLCIVIFAAILRFYKLGEVPASMNADEAAIGYNAYSILKTGKDEYGTKFPLLFRSFDDYKLPAYIYLTVPSVAVFGLQDASVRLPSAFFGTLTVLATYLFVDALFANPVIALLSALLLAISPWHLQFSRSAYEANLAVFFAVAGMTCLLRAVKRTAWYIPGFILLALSVWSYHSSRIFIPLILIGFFALYIRDILKSKLIFSIGVILCIGICIPLLLLSLSSSGLVRAKGVSALDDPGLTARNASWRLTDINMDIPFSNIF